MDISIVICTRNREQSLERAIASCLKQSIAPREIIVVDDGALNDEFVSRQHNLAEKNGIKFRYIRKDENARGLTKSRNIGWRLATGEIVQFIDDDAELPEGALKLVEEVFSYDNQHQLVAVDFPIDEQSRSRAGRRIIERCYEIAGLWSLGRRFRRHYQLPKSLKEISHLQPVRFLQGGSMAIRKEALEKVGGFDENLGESAMGEDKDISIRLDKVGYIARITSLAVIHHSEPAGRVNGFQLGYETTFNYLYINSKAGELAVGEMLLIGYNLAILLATEIVFAFAGNTRFHLNQIVGLLAGVYRFILN